MSLNLFVNDDDPYPHDHPFDFLSVRLLGPSYVEEIYATNGRLIQTRTRGRLQLIPAEHIHRVSPRGPTLGLCLYGPKRRDWGFVSPKRGWVPLREWMKLPIEEREVWSR